MSHAGSTLVLGGARSGKSTFAEQVTCRNGHPKIYIATATAGDDEMRARIAHHRRRRGEGWRTIEEPLQICEVIAREALADRVVLLDCLTLWLSNVMHAGLLVDAETRRLADQLQRTACPIVLVSNEVGLGLVPETPLGRSFRDAQGQLNQLIAASVPNVVFVAAGLPLWLKHHPAQGTSQ
ncbi:bifunctional adenosylcobinamide kinase/adenosylcobinamide-phosphate guanylyltransferase [Bradyrhizobium sp. LHD-71]|uniref:bifunctional adenosylcobinamide kinase/adenosylcobinamide-phosphate guanylyltransferase n=1 Tax=Bradyrhizobium sp. LHD-71 TaxID=3072141 RepID=UPI00280D2865|nr:bifunctional adenosylcobinamide kinase/adenosylcobinamide-phosphate guanylyltransferase [Bradyrhizobium sp. LHD-71]MDQ8729721.1 bifunctional adenosylcobinamide kinase/adenosylcobinamide-phosphate guanylyltransferase [Bradyrhizobium sp. LHD-71]